MSASRVRRPRRHRRYPRLTLRIDVELETAHERTAVVATTLGAGGLFVATEAPWFPGTALVAHFRLPDADAPLAMEARVAWIHQPGDPRSSPGMGLEFVDASSRAALAERLERWAVEREPSGANEL